MAFDPNSARYRTCCCHVRKCTIAIGIVECLGVLIQLTETIFKYVDTNKENGSGMLEYTYNITNIDHYFDTTKFVGEIGGIAIGLIVLILLFVGVCKENRYYLIPHLITQIIGLIGSVVLLILFVIGVHFSFWVNWIQTMVTLTITPIIQIWFFIVILKCYLFFRDKKRAIGHSGPVAVKDQATPKNEV